MLSFYNFTGVSFETSERYHSVHEARVVDDQYSLEDANQNQEDAYQLSLETLKYQLEALTINVKENKNAIKSILNKRTKDLDQTKVQELEKQLDFLKDENNKLKNA